MKILTDITCLAVALFALFALSAGVSPGPAQSGLAESPTVTPTPCPHCTGTPIPPNTPLNDLGQGTYFPPNHAPSTTPVQGGLYSGGYNQRPPAHEATGIDIAEHDIVPRDMDGNEDSDGAIVMISIGMCNTTKEFGGALGIGRKYGFVGRTMGDPSVTPSPNWRNPKLVVIDCAQSGQDAEAWANNSAPPATPTPSCTPSPGASCTPNPWLECLRRLEEAPSPGPYSMRQVQVVWLKEALADPEASPYGVWPKHVNDLKDRLKTILGHLADSAYGFDNLKLVFLSPRTRAWTTNGQGFTHSPEPDAYETGFADKWVIQEQGQHAAWPWLSWGPYLWTDGMNARSDGLTWPCNYVTKDCVHPTVDGVTKVVDQLLAFFKTDPVATPWFLKTPDDPEDRPTFSPSPTPIAVPAGTPVTFQVSATPGAGGAEIAEYVWTFDDGDYAYDPDNQPQTEVTKTFWVRSRPNHPYQVHVTAIDEDGNAGFANILVTVNPTPTPTPGPRRLSLADDTKHRRAQAPRSKQGAAPKVATQSVKSAGGEVLGNRH